VTRDRWFGRVGPREQLTLTATCREVDGWRVAATIAGEKLAEWAVEALNEATRAAIAARWSAGGAGEPGAAGASSVTESITAGDDEAKEPKHEPPAKLLRLPQPGSSLPRPLSPRSTR
jgi:hypothetical protein